MTCPFDGCGAASGRAHYTRLVSSFTPKQVDLLAHEVAGLVFVAEGALARSRDADPALRASVERLRVFADVLRDWAQNH